MKNSKNLENRVFQPIRENFEKNRCFQFEYENFERPENNLNILSRKFYLQFCLDNSAGSKMHFLKYFSTFRGLF